MTIRRRLSLNVFATVSVLITTYGLVLVGASYYDRLQTDENALQLQVQNWFRLNHQVAQYLEKGLLAVASGAALDEKELEELTENVIHSFILLEKGARIKAQFISLSESERVYQKLEDIREHFGLINAELDQALALYRKGNKRSALKLITGSITHAKLDQTFAQMVEQALESEEQQLSQIVNAQSALRIKLIFFACLVGVLGIFLSALLMFQINRSIQKSISRAKEALLKGTTEIGAGNLEARIDYQSKDELSVVAEAFNKMSKDLKSAWDLIGDQQNQIATAAKMSALGEMAGGVAHEINNPLAIIKNLAGQMQLLLRDPELDKARLTKMAGQIELTTNRIAKIVQGLRIFSRDGSKERSQSVLVHQLIEDTLGFCMERFKSHGVELRYAKCPDDLIFEGRSVEISQVLLNLLNNAHDAVEKLEDRWVKIETTDFKDHLEISVIDSGSGITPEVKKKIFQPFFTTKEVGKGTGLGLSVSVGIVESHEGELKLDTSGPNTKFIIRLPKSQTRERKLDPKVAA